MGLMGSSLTGRLWHPVWAIQCGLVLAGLVFLLAVGMARRNSDKIINNRTLLLIFAFALGGIPYFIHILVRGDSVRRYSPFILSGPILVMSLFAIWLICDFLAARKNHISPSVLSGIDSG